MISIFPDFSLDRSRMSLINVNSILLAPCMFRAFSAMLSGMFSRRVSSFKPMMVLMGVRISWLMLVKK